MRGVVQRVLSAKAVIDGETVGEIGQGLLVLVCAMPTDTEAAAGRFLDKLLKLRIFENDAGKLHHAVTDIDGTGTVGGLLLVSQFTLAADVTGGNRPSFTAAAPPDLARHLFDYVVMQAQQRHAVVATGRFAADTQVHLVNNGPLTIPLDIA